uniref:Reverse transcriptase zinc-binding domain-containing protein n=1 Tax=Podarcis muralis TaxID=64176 RepID=A0A670KIL2_PODMU
MNILPKLLFLFQMIPIIGKDDCFKKWKTDLTKFIWQGKKPRIKHKLLTGIKERGGFGLPDLRLYYDVACFTWIKDWIKLDNSDILDLEEWNNRYGCIITKLKKNISKMYNLLLEWELKDEKVKEVMIKWACDIGYVIRLEQWEKLWKDIKFTACYTIRENFMKMVYQWYLTPVKFAKIYKLKSNTCWRCKKEIGTMFHMWWECRPIKQFWNEIYEELKKMFKISFSKKPEAFLLGLITNDIPENQRKVFHYAITAARMLIAKNWKGRKIPSVKDWQIKFCEYINLARLTAYIREQSDQKLLKEWGCAKEYMKNIVLE